MRVKELIKNYELSVKLINRKVTVYQLLTMNIKELEEIGELIGVEMTKIKANPLKNDNEASNKINKFLDILKEIYNAKVEVMKEKERKEELEKQIRKIKELLDEKEESKLKKAKKKDLEDQLNKLISELNNLK